MEHANNLPLFNYAPACIKYRCYFTVTVISEGISMIKPLDSPNKN